MKKGFLVVFLACTMVVYAQAQMFVGGSLGFDYNARKVSSGSTSNKRPSETTFEVSPMLGYFVSDKFAVGATVSLGFTSWNSRASEPFKEKSVEWSLFPGVRYSLLSIGDFSFWAQGGMGIFGSSSKTSQGSTTTNGPSVFGFGINVMPLLSYSLTDRINLEASSNLARFGFESWTVKRGSGDSQLKNTESSFGFGINSHDLFSTPFQIGIIFKF